jgi:hypothetical protein
VRVWKCLEHGGVRGANASAKRSSRATESASEG